MKKVATVITLVLCQFLSLAHEFWLSPKKFSVAVGEEVGIDFLVGENFEGEPWDVQLSRVVKLEHYQLSQMKSLMTTLKPSEKEKLKLKFSTEGTQLIYFQSQDSFIELEAEKFNAYLKEDGLEDTYDQRKRTNTLDKPAKEYYSRFTKVLLQAGNKVDDTYRKKVGARLEIVPLQNPYALQKGDYLQCQVLIDGKPALHQMVKVWNKVTGRTFLQNIYTEKDGTIKFPINAQGPWMVSTVKMIPSEKPDADWRSMWASLTFGIQ